MHAWFFHEIISANHKEAINLCSSLHNNFVDIV